MGIAYQRSLKAGGDKQRDQLRAAQRLWIQYRDANCLLLRRSVRAPSRASTPTACTA